MGIQPKTPISEIKENVILIDWLTVTLHDYSVRDVQVLLGLDPDEFTWTESRVFRNGYPMQTTFNNITIRWGADRVEYYTSDAKKSAEDKVRYDMGISLDMTGQGCRAFETYGHGDWFRLLSKICSDDRKIKFTRLDLAFDDHTGVLPMEQMRSDLEDRNYIFRGKNTGLQWSDDIEDDIQGLTLYIGSKSSPVLIRIYDKAAERGFDHSLHWIRVELRLRDDRALVAVAKILEHEDIGKVFSGVLHNYFSFRVPSDDTNKSRWPMSTYWAALIGDAEKISLWISPGEPYNFRKTEQWMIDQVGQAIITYYRVHGSLAGLLNAVQSRHPELADKYKSVIAEADRQRELRRRQRAQAKRKSNEVRKIYGFAEISEDDPAYEEDIFDILGDCLRDLPDPDDPSKCRNYS